MTRLQQDAHRLMGSERRQRVLVGAFVLGWLTACARSDVKHPVTPSAVAGSTNGYFDGRFNLDNDSGMGLWIRLENVDNKRTFKMAFQDIGAPPYAIEIEPGTYRI